MAKWLAYIALSCSLGAVLISEASATPVDPHWYDLRSTSVSAAGAYAQLSDASALTSNWDSVANPASFIDFEMWANQRRGSPGTPGLWAEAGYTDGSSGRSSTNQRGTFCASQYLDSNSSPQYGELTIKANDMAAHSIELDPNPSGDGRWVVYLDGTLDCLMPATGSTLQSIDVGVESSDTGNSFASGSTAAALEYWDPAAKVWTDWASGDVLPSNGASWTSTYSAGPYPGPTATFNQ